MNNEQIIDYAIEDEQQSYELYKSTAKRLNNGISPLLMKMANMEKGHAAKLRAFKKGKNSSIGKTEVNDLKISDYLEAAEIDENSTAQDVLIYAIKSEEKAAALYTELSRRFSDIDNDNLFELLAREELKHKHDLEQAFTEGKYVEEK